MYSLTDLNHMLARYLSTVDIWFVYEFKFLRENFLPQRGHAQIRVFDES